MTSSSPGWKPAPSRRNSGLFATALLWLLLIGWAQLRQTASYFGYLLQRNPFPPLPLPSLAMVPLWGAHGLRLLLVALFFLTAWNAGHGALSRFLPTFGKKDGAEEWGEPSQRFLLETCAGLMLWSTAGLLLAVAGLSQPVTLRLASMAAAGILLASRKKDFFIPVRAALGSLRDGAAGDRRLPFALLVLLGIFYLACSVTPEVFADSLTYVLPTPQACLLQGRLTDLPGNLISRYPGFGQMLYLWGLAWGDDRVCKLMNLGFAGLWTVSVRNWAASRWGRAAGLWAAVFLLASPFIGACVWSCVYEPLMGLFLVLSFSVWNRAWGDENPSARNRSLFMAGLLLGAAAASKYTAVFALPFFAADLARLSFRGKRLPLKSGLAFALGAGLPLLPWLVRNGLVCGNPVYPYAADFLGNASALQRELFHRLAVEQRTGVDLPGRFFMIIRESLQGAWDGRFGFVGPLLLVLLPFLPLLRRVEKDAGRNASLRPLLLFAAGSYGAYALSTGFLRYYIPSMGLLFAAAGGVMGAFSDRLPPARSRMMGIAATLLVLSELLSMALIFHLHFNGWEVVLGRRSGADYLRTPHGTAYRSPPQGAWDYLSLHGGKSDKVYLLGEVRGFRCPSPYYGNWLYDRPIYASWFEDEGLSAEAVVKKLRGDGFTYVLFNPEEFEVNVVEDYRTAAWRENLSAVFERMSPPIYRDPWTVLFRVPEEAS